MSGKKFKFIAAVCVLLERDEKILLIRRANTGFADGLYTLPTGHVDGGESFVEAAARETKEEVDVSVELDDLELFHMSQHVYGPTNECITFFYKAGKWQGTPQNNEPDKCDDVQWFAKDNLPEDILLNVRDALDNIDGHVSQKTYPLAADKTMEVLSRKNGSRKPGMK